MHDELKIEDIPEALKQQIAEEAVRNYKRAISSKGGKANLGKKRTRTKKHPNQSELSRKAVNARWAKYRAAKAAEQSEAEKEQKS